MLALPHLFHFLSLLRLNKSKGICFLVLMLSFTARGWANEHPWRIDQSLALPGWLSISGQHRVRYETVDEQFRAGGNGDDQILVFRTNVLAEVMLQNWKFGFEILDARQSYAKENTPISTSVVNPLDVLQLYTQWTVEDLLAKNSISSFRVGRFTIDIGSRRFVARNLFRNTITAFTGVDWQWIGGNGNKFRVFYTLPVNRLPSERNRLIDNRSEGDDQNVEVKFWGTAYTFSNQALVQSGSRVDLFYFGLNENDSHNRPTRNRDIHTFGGRIFKKPQVNQFDYQVESAFQFGESRLSTANTDQQDLDHFAHFHHIQLGYQFDAMWKPRLSGQLDFASGDDDPSDGDNNRFDTLFGARRFEFGPTGIFGPFARSNLITPGIRLQIKPSPHTSMLFAHRAYWLASNKDAWTAARVRDASGDSGSYIGQQFEMRFRWEVVPKNIRFEAGGAYLFKGKFANNAPNATNEGDPNYVYSQLIFNF